MSTHGSTPNLSSARPAVVCRGLTKAYAANGAAPVMALRGVDLEVHRGELMLLMGPSGCGKTTLISVIAGILDQTDGTCTVFGRDFKSLSSDERMGFRGEKIGFVFQAFNLLPTLTTTENVSIPLLLNGIDRTKAERRAREMLARVGLADRVDAKPSQLSGGQQQRVAIARAMVHDPMLVVCDEPTSALDHDSGRQVMDLLSEVVVGSDRTLIVVTHDPRITEYADRVARMDDGRISDVGTMRNALPAGATEETDVR